MSGTVTLNGMISGMDTQGIINSLIAVAQKPVTDLQDKKSVVNDKISAWQDANTRLAAVKSKVELLSQSSTFGTKTISSGDESIIKGTATSDALAGTYYLKVEQLARANQLQSTGFATAASQVGTGTFSIKAGSATAKDITITDANNSLTGLRDAINKSGAGVTATIVNDGSSSGSAYHLVLTSNSSGEANAINITNNLTGGPTTSFTTIQAAQDARVAMGEDKTDANGNVISNAIRIQSSTNTLTDLIPGVTLNLQKVDTTKTVEITVQNDTASTKQAIKDFVDQYNNLIKFVNNQFKYDTASSSGGGPLFGDANLATIQSDLVGKVSNPIADISKDTDDTQTPRPLVMLGQIGLTMSTSNDSTLTVDETQLDNMLATRLTDVKSLFMAIGSPSDPAVTYVASTDQTKASSEAGYAINVTSVATQTKTTAGTTMADALEQDEQLNINGQAIQLLKDMTQQQVVDKINEIKNKTGVIASITDNYLTLTSTQYGSAKTITASSSLAAGPGTTGLGITQSRVTAGAEQTDQLTKNETLTVNGQTIELKQGMTAIQVVSKINEFTSKTGVTASRTKADGTGIGNYLTLRSTLAGADHTITVTSDVSNGGATPVKKSSGIGNVTITESSFGGETGTGTGAIGSGSSELGADIQGTINGELATGKGQILTGNSGNKNTSGLMISVNAQTTGNYGNIRFAQGIGSSIQSYLAFITDFTTGTVTGAQKTLQSEITDIDTQISTMQDRILVKRDQLTQKFATMESSLSKLKGDSDYLTGQFAQLSNSKK